MKNKSLQKSDETVFSLSTRAERITLNYNQKSQYHYVFQENLHANDGRRLAASMLGFGQRH